MLARKLGPFCYLLPEAWRHRFDPSNLRVLYIFRQVLK